MPDLGDTAICLVAKNGKHKPRWESVDYIYRNGFGKASIMLYCTECRRNGESIVNYFKDIKWADANGMIEGSR